MFRSAQIALIAAFSSVALPAMTVVLAQPASAQMADNAYVLGPDDVVDVYIYGQYK